jgi:MFS family permease
MFNISTFVTHSAARAVGFAFVGSGLVLGSWAALIPHIKQKFALDEAQLGLLLLCLPAGIILMNPLSIPILRRFGAVGSTLWSLLLCGSLFILPFALPALWQVASALFLLGMAFSALNIAMNTCASFLEQKAGLRIFSTCHGLWSAGAMTGSALAGAATGSGVLPFVYATLLSIGIAGLALAIKAGLAQVPEDAPSPLEKKQKKAGFVLPSKALLPLIILSLCTNLTEGTMTDWSAVYVREVVGGTAGLAGLSFSVYAFFMAAGRFLGDGVIARFGGKIILQIGGIMVASGLAIAILLPYPISVPFGFALVGAGVSLGAPILYAAASKAPGMAKGAGLATMNTFAMMSFLTGPAIIGFLAKLFSLPIAFGVVALIAVVWSWKARRLEG